MDCKHGISDMAKDSNITFLHFDGVAYEHLIMKAQTDFELFEVCSRIAQINGAPFYSVLRFPKSTDNSLSSLGVVSNWPVELIADYDEMGLFENSPVIQHLRNSTDPLVFDTKQINKDRKDKKGNLAVELFEKHGILYGVYFCVHDAKGTMGAVSFSGPDPVFKDDACERLKYFSSLIFSRISLLRSQDEQANYDLNSTELRFLQFVSVGMSLDDISTESGLSVYVVNKYLQSCMEKLGCESRIHAVSKALRLGLIS